MLKSEDLMFFRYGFIRVSEKFVKQVIRKILVLFTNHCSQEEFRAWLCEHKGIDYGMLARACMSADVLVSVDHLTSERIG